MKAVIKTGGKQYYVGVGDVVYIELLDKEADSVVKFDEVLMLDNNVDAKTLKGAVVEGKVIKNGKAKKILVYKYRAKKKSRKTQGHRQPYTKVEITKIEAK